MIRLITSVFVLLSVTFTKKHKSHKNKHLRRGQKEHELMLETNQPHYD